VVFNLSVSPFSPPALSPLLCSCHRGPSPLVLFLFFSSSALASLVFSHGAASAPHDPRPVRLGAVDGEPAGPWRAGLRLPVGGEQEGRPAEWIVPPAGDHAPNPPEGYVVSFIRFHERGFAAPASRFMRALCHRYGVELHNFAPNAISQAPHLWASARGI
jgi:hypothetical protein